MGNPSPNPFDVDLESQDTSYGPQSSVQQHNMRKVLTDLMSDPGRRATCERLWELVGDIGLAGSRDKDTEEEITSILEREELQPWRDVLAIAVERLEDHDESDSPFRHSSVSSQVTSSSKSTSTKSGSAGNSKAAPDQTSQSSRPSTTSG